MEVQVENNIGGNSNETASTNSSNNGLTCNNAGSIQIVDLVSDSHSGSNEDEEYSLPGLDSENEDNKLISKSKLLKSLSDIDNIVINDHCSITPDGGIFMHHTNDPSEVPENATNCPLGENIVITNGSAQSTDSNNGETENER